MWKYCRSAVIFILLFITYQTAFALDLQREDSFITIADIHFNPFLGCTKQHMPCLLLSKLKSTPFQEWETVFNQYGDKQISQHYQDTNYILLKSTLSQLQQVTQQSRPKFVLVLGDFLAHNFREQYVSYSTDKSKNSYQAFVKKTLQFVTYEIEKIFPEIDVYPVIGNNDTYTGDYSVIPNGIFLKDTLQTWGVFIKNNQNLSSFYQTFSTAGYYEVTLPNLHNKIIVLNTVLFSDRVHNKAVKKAAFLELKWLHTRLLAAQQQHQHVLLAFHIPIGIDVYATIKNKFDIKEFWDTNYTNLFETELQQFSKIVMGILPAHIHMDTFQLIVLKQLADIPVNFTPSISPIFGNDPGFKVYLYDKETLKLKSAISYRYPLNDESSKWIKEFSFSKEYRPKLDAIV